VWLEKVAPFFAAAAAAASAAWAPKAGEAYWGTAVDVTVGGEPHALMLGVPASFEVPRGSALSFGPGLTTSALTGACDVTAFVAHGRVTGTRTTCVPRDAVVTVNVAWQGETPSFMTRLIFVAGSVLSALAFVVIIVDQK